MAGNPFTAVDLNNRAGSLAYGVWRALQDARDFKLWLDDSIHTDAILTAAPYSVASADLAIIRSSMSDLGGTSGLWAVGHGSFAPAGASNYFFNAKNLSGLNYTG